jgi:hypothetical protein
VRELGRRTIEGDLQMRKETCHRVAEGGKGGRGVHGRRAPLVGRMWRAGCSVLAASAYCEVGRPALRRSRKRPDEVGQQRMRRTDSI